MEYYSSTLSRNSNDSPKYQEVDNIKVE